MKKKDLENLTTEELKTMALDLWKQLRGADHPKVKFKEVEFSNLRRDEILTAIWATHAAIGSIGLPGSEIKITEKHLGPDPTLFKIS